MIVAALEKLSYIATMVVLYLQHRAPPNQLIWVVPDAILCLLFIASYVKTPATSQTRQEA